MDISVKVGDYRTEAIDAVVIGIFEDNDPAMIEFLQTVNQAMEGAISRLRNLGDFAGKSKQATILYTEDRITAPRLALVGMGKKDEFNMEKAREVSGGIARKLRDVGVKTLAIPIPPHASLEIVQAMVEGSLLALYHFTQHKTESLDEIKELESITFLVPDEPSRLAVEEAVLLGEIIAGGVIIARDLSNQPGNHLTPKMFAEKAQEIASASDLTLEIFNLKQLEEKAFGALLAVAQGSCEEPRFIVLEHVPTGENHETVVFVGKGITFDSGGISLKPGKGMEQMKHDMSGAAAVLGAMQVVSSLGLNLHVVGLIAASENMPSATAVKPGDVVTSYGGKTIEVINTDAEGRLVLADALSYAAQYSPAAIIDLATLTGAVVTALGHFAAGMMGTDDDLMARLESAGEKTHERVWQLPLWDDYDEQITSHTADVKNIGDGTAGAIIGGAFLKKFVEGHPWVHLDIAGTASEMKGSSYLPRTASGYGVRLLVQVVQDWVSQS